MRHCLIIAAHQRSEDVSGFFAADCIIVNPVFFFMGIVSPEKYESYIFIIIMKNV